MCVCPTPNGVDIVDYSAAAGTFTHERHERCVQVEIVKSHTHTHGLACGRHARVCHKTDIASSTARRRHTRRSPGMKSLSGCGCGRCCTRRTAITSPITSALRSHRRWRTVCSTQKVTFSDFFCSLLVRCPRSCCTTLWSNCERMWRVGGWVRMSVRAGAR